ncbi:MAG: hypothetical protein KDA76_16780 [Planctomycetaceae bacterium]|nr:hypothetical protein [Planctomycetaceae bacterium]
MSAGITGMLLQEGEPSSGARNMAVDEWLLGQAIGQSWLALRFYRWSEPTLSVGYFQERSAVPLPASLEHLPRVRRLSGGGAILHDRELTYSLALPATHPLGSTPVELYRLMHRAMIMGLAEQGIETRMREAEQAELNGAFLCFLRGDRHDVILGKHKILGSAQRRRKGAILQHGSLILQASRLAPEVPGIEELTGRAVETTHLMNFVVAHLQPLAQDWQPLDRSLPDYQREISRLEVHYC